MISSKFKSPLHEMATTTQTELWNDSCSVDELRQAIAHGAVGATSNPVIVGEVLKKELTEWSEPIRRIIAQMPTVIKSARIRIFPASSSFFGNTMACWYCNVTADKRIMTRALKTANNPNDSGV